MDVEDMPAAIREAARVLEHGGQFGICVTHPLSDAGRFASDEMDAAFVIRDSYFGRRRFEDRFERDGLQITFHGWMYALDDYCRALDEVGFLIRRLREPAPNDDAVRRYPSFERRRRIPLFLQIGAVKL